MPQTGSRAVAVLLTALVAFGPLSTDLYLPSLPLLGRVFAADPGTVQLTLSVFLIGFAVSQLVYGPLSDRFGRRPVLLGGILLFGLAGLGCIAAQSIEQLIVARFFQAVGACCGPVIGRAVVRDIYGREGAARVLAYMAAAVALAPTVGPVLGGQLTELFGWRANFVALAAIAAAMLAAVALLLDETNRNKDPYAIAPARLVANYATLLGNRRYLGYALVTAFAYSGIFAFISGSSFVLIERIGLSPTAYGLSFGVVVAGYVAGSFGAGRLTMGYGIDRMIALGSLVAVASGLLGLGLALLGVVTVPAILGPVFGFMAGAGLILPNAMAGAVGPFPNMAGLASALLGFVQMLVAAVVGGLVGQMLDAGSLPMMGAIAAVALAAMGVSRWILGHDRPGLAGPHSSS